MYFSYFFEKGDFDRPEKSPENRQRTFTPKFRNFIHTNPYKSCPNYLVLLLISKINNSNVKNCLCP
jgi:hypothetical protein